MQNLDIFWTRSIFITLTYSEPEAYLEPWHILNQKHIQNPGTFTTLLYSEPRYIQNAGIFRILDIFSNLLNIYDEAFCENSKYFQQELSQIIIIFTVYKLTAFSSS